MGKILRLLDLAIIWVKSRFFMTPILKRTSLYYTSLISGSRKYKNIGMLTGKTWQLLDFAKFAAKFWIYFGLNFKMDAIS